MTIGDVKFNLETIDNLNRIARIKVCQEASKTISSMESKFAEIERIAETMKANAGSVMHVYDKTDHEYHSLKAVGVDVLHDYAATILEIIGDEP